jgi:DNA polymerase alpha subunit A
MCGTHLKVQREDVDPEDTHSYFDHSLQTPDRLIKFVRLCEIDAYFQMAIASRVQMLPLTKQLTNLAGNSWYVFRLFHEIDPDKQESHSQWWSCCTKRVHFASRVPPIEVRLPRQNFPAEEDPNSCERRQ